MANKKDDSDPFKKMMEYFDSKLAFINNSITASEKNIENKIAESEKTVTDHIDLKYNELSEQITKLEERISSLEAESAQKTWDIEELRRESDCKSTYISTLEMKVNQRNLIIYNFEESEVTPEDLLSNLITFFTNVMKLIIKHSDIDVVYRLGKASPRKTRPIFVSFTTLNMRNYINSARRNLRDTKISIAEDCPKEVIEKRKQLLPALLGAKKQKKKAFFKYGTLLVNGAVCTEEEIANYSRVYSESSKRARSTEVVSPTNQQEKKKPKNLKLSLLKNAGRQRSLSTSNSPINGSKPITDFFNSNGNTSLNSRTDCYNYQD